MFKKILVPIDDSVMAQNAARAALAIAEKFNSSLTLLHVLGYYMAEVFVGLPETMPVITQSMVREWEVNGRNLLEETRARLKSEGVEIKTELLWGNPAGIICSKVEEEGYDLVVMGSHGRDKLGEFFLGSVSDRVSRIAACPVMIVKNKI